MRIKKNCIDCGIKLNFGTGTTKKKLRCRPCRNKHEDKSRKEYIKTYKKK